MSADAERTSTGAGRPGDEGGGPLPAGRFSTWLAEVQSAIDGRGTSDVACDGCTACCTSSQFVHVAPDEVDALARIPAALLFPAPGAPPGHVLLGYDAAGRCPMLGAEGCSIYEHRPRTCRTYDCRIFPATGLDVDDEPDKAAIAARARRWRFAPPTDAERHLRGALQAAAAHLRDHPDALPDAVPGGAGRPSRTQLAVLAVEVHDVFLRRDADGPVAVADPGPDAVRVAVTRRLGASRAG
jgi:Fe-S-cluster containining protein